MSIADSIKMERSKMPDGSLKFLVNRRDFSKSFGPNESIKIVTPTAEYTVKPRNNYSILQDQDPSKLNTDHMDTYFQVQEDGAKWQDTMEELGTLQSFLLDFQQFGFGEMDILNFKRETNSHSIPTQIIEEALTAVLHSRIQKFNTTNKPMSEAEQKIYDRLSTFRPYVEALAGEMFLTFQPLQNEKKEVYGPVYWVKYYVGDGKFIHAQVFDPLP